MRDKIKNILQLYGTKRNQKECSSGIGLEHTELDDLPQEIYERKKESESNYHQQSSEKTKQIKKENEPEEDMQTKSLEKLSETRKREAQDSASSCHSHNEKRRRRSSGGDTIAYLWGKSETDFQLREAELKLFREELELTKSIKNLLCQQSQIMFPVLRKPAEKLRTSRAHPQFHLLFRF